MFCSKGKPFFKVDSSGGFLTAWPSLLHGPGEQAVPVSQDMPKKLKHGTHFEHGNETSPVIKLRCRVHPRQISVFCAELKASNIPLKPVAPLMSLIQALPKFYFA